MFESSTPSHFHAAEKTGIFQIIKAVTRFSLRTFADIRGHIWTYKPAQKPAYFFLLLALCAPVQSATVLGVYHLYRQSPYTQEATYPIINQYGYSWPGGCLSCSTQDFQFSRALLYAQNALIRVQWICNDVQNSIEIVHTDYGPQNITRIGVITCDGSTSARNGDLVFTTQWNSLVDNLKNKNIGYRVKGNPNNPPLILMVKIEIYYQY